MCDKTNVKRPKGFETTGYLIVIHDSVDKPVD